MSEQVEVSQELEPEFEPPTVLDEEDPRARKLAALAKARAAKAAKRAARVALGPSAPKAPRRNPPKPRAPAKPPAAMAEDLAAPTTLEELCSLARLGPDAFISVERVSPKVWSGVPCAGMLENIRAPLSREDFARTYGGGTYKLILLGSDEHTLDPVTGLPRVTQLAPPVTVIVPLGAYAPTLVSAEEEESDMRFVPYARSNGGRVTGPATSADAEIYKTQLTHEERMHERMQEQERAARSDIYQLVESMRESFQEQMRMMREEAAERDRLREQQLERERMERERAERFAERQLQRPSETAQLGEALSSIVNAMKPSGNPDLAEQSARERENLIASHRLELERITALCEKRTRDADDRAETRIRDAEQRADARVRDAEQRAEKLVRDAKDDCARQIEDIRRFMEARLSDEQRQHERDTTIANTSWEGRMETQRAMYENRISVLTDTIARMREEAEQLKRNLEQSQDLAMQIQKARSAAELLGYRLEREDEEEEEEEVSWTKLLANMAKSTVSNLPQILQAAGNLKGAQPAQPAQAAQAPRAAAAPQPAARLISNYQPPAFAQDDLSIFASPTDAVPLFGTPSSPTPARAPAPAPAAPLPMPVAAPTPMPVAAPASAPAAAPPAPTAAPAAPDTAAPDAAATGTTVPKELEQLILQIAQALENAFESGVEPSAVAQHLLQALPANELRQFIAVVPVETFLKVVQQALPDNALNRHAGNKFVRDVYAALG